MVTARAWLDWEKHAGALLYWTEYQVQRYRCFHNRSVFLEMSPPQTVSGDISVTFSDIQQCSQGHS